MNIKVLKAPRLTEKTVLQKELTNQVTFLVDKAANKIEIKRAVETMFKVSVVNVNTVNTLGKVKRMGRYIGKRPDWKKAIVTLKPGDKIEYFEGA
ncbi:MAG: 50S ribosomal protein L23 [Deltaproteobacteria bacterium]|nr:50S ribosomal protein L23 [Deltaproteobacteria bacterium]